MQQILLEEIGCYGERIYPPMVTLPVFIDQVRSSDPACHDVVGRRLSQRVCDGQSACSLNNGRYCKARRRLALRLPQRLGKQLGLTLERAAAKQRSWRGRSVKISDATTVSMPDTPLNQHVRPGLRSVQ